VVNIRPLVVTSGEPAGIGPDLCVQFAAQQGQPALVVIADKFLLKKRAAQLGLPLLIRDYVMGEAVMTQPDTLTVLHVPVAVPVKAGELNAANSHYVLQTLSRAIQGCLLGEFSAMVTAPVHKGVINDAGIAFTGHTEFLAEETDTPLVVMMLVGGGMRVALATTHLPLRYHRTFVGASAAHLAARSTTPFRHSTAAYLGRRTQSACG
jgi:4-hydroxythreonine-4-phosphate dehydrogenase